MAFHHGARDLRVSGLIGAYQTYGLHAGKEQKRADNDEGKQVG